VATYQNPYPTTDYTPGESNARAVENTPDIEAPPGEELPPGGGEEIPPQRGHQPSRGRHGHHGSSQSDR
jgi:hypothetical protein